METVIRAFVSALRDRGIHVRLVFLGGYKAKKHDLSWLEGLDYEILLPSFLFKGYFRIFFEIRKLSKLILEEEPDIFIGLNNSAISHLWKVRNRTYPFKIFSWVHFALAILHNPRVLKKADYHLSISSGISHDLEESLGIERNKIFTIYNPIKLDSNQGKSIIERPSAENPPSFLFVGRLTEQKDPLLLINAVAALKGKWKLHIVGDGPLRGDMEARVRSFHLEDNIIFHGWQANAWEYIRSLTNVSALILSSRNEGFPMVLLEAISRGIFCIASNCETGPADIINEENGKLFEAGDVLDLRQKLQELIDSKGLDLPSQGTIQQSIIKFSSSNYVDRVLRAFENGQQDLR